MIRIVLLMVLLLPHLAQAEDRLGRLFLTPAERSNLDYVRQTSKPPDKTIKSEVSEESAEPGEVTPSAPVSAVTVQGYVKRSDGKGTVWVNRRPLRETSTQGEIGVGRVGGTDGRVRLKISGAEKEVALKAGQTYDPVSGAVVEHARDLPETVRPEMTPVDGKSGKPAAAPDAPKKP
jgi:hypothetical protein